MKIVMRPIDRRIEKVDQVIISRIKDAGRAPSKQIMFISRDAEGIGTAFWGTAKIKLFN